MATWTRLCRALTVGLLVLVFVTPTRGQKDEKKDNNRKVQIETYDGVQLQGTLWPSNGKRDACVILLHNFDKTKGGSSHQDGWDDLGDALQKDGYTVLSFDFRGFGDSRTILPSFWQKSQPGLKATKRNSTTIDQKDFSQAYYANLVNDISAAKGFLDRQNDQNKVNSSNIIVIGAGEGATLGAMWMASQFHLARASGGFVPAGGASESDGRDLVCGVWLTISPTLGGARAAAGLHHSLLEIGKKEKVPMLFLYGQNDKAGESTAMFNLKNIVPSYKQNKPPKEAAFELTRDYLINGTSLTGSKLLTKTLDTPNIINFYLDSAMKKRGAREAKNRETVKSAYFWLLPGKQTRPAKRSGEESVGAVPVRELQLYP